MVNKTLNDLFLDTLKDIYYAEKQILKALPKMARAAQDPQLKDGFETHRVETEGHVDRLEQIFEICEKPARGKQCDAILGILDEGKEIMEEYKGTIALDAGLISAAQAVEHYERHDTARCAPGPNSSTCRRPSPCSRPPSPRSGHLTQSLRYWHSALKIRRRPDRPSVNQKDPQ